MNLRRTLRLTVLVAGLTTAFALPTISSQAAVRGIPKIATGGFGDFQNSYAWSMAWFKGKLYVGTNHNELCIEQETYQFYHPGKTYYTVHPMPEVTCPADPYDIDARAEIWQYTPATATWTMVFKSPANVPNPREPGKFVARDSAFRGMVVQRDANGQQALYVGGVTLDEYIPELASTDPPRILRTTDGVTFTPLNGSPATLQTANGPFPAIGYRAMVSYKGRLLVTATRGLLGDGVVEEIGKPYSTSPTYTQIQPSTIEAYELGVYNGHLYIGGGDSVNNTGYAVWRTDATSVPFTYTTILNGGAGRGNDITSVVSMHAFQGRLYIGSSGWYTTPIPHSELIRINPDDSWDLVAGNPRMTSVGQKNPISGLPDGFGNPFSAHFWRQDDFKNALYVGTNDWSYYFRFKPALNPIFQSQYGFDIWTSCDGQYWKNLTQDAFGDGRYNFGARTFASTSGALFIGSANHVQGTSVWEDKVGTGCLAPGSTVGSVPTPTNLPTTTPAPAPLPVSAPTRLLTDLQTCGTVLTWDASPDATEYTILRTTLRRLTVAVGARPPDPLPESAVPNPLSEAGGAASVVVAQAPVAIGKTTTPSFVDTTAVPGTQYLYQVVSAANGVTSSPSNSALAPSARPATTFAEASAAIANAASRGDLAAGADRTFARLLADAQRLAVFDRAAAAGALTTLLAQFSAGSVTLPTAQSDLGDVIFRLQRALTEPTLSCVSRG